MARFAEGDGWDSEEDENEFYNAMAAGYTAAKPVLAEFLAYLDAMPKKRIISGRFVGTASKDMCAVATFCASRGFDWKRLLEVEKESRRQRFEALDGCAENGDGGYGWEGATVNAGEEAGLPTHVAYNLAWNNDMVWDHITDRYEWQPTQYALVTRPIYQMRHDKEGNVVRDSDGVRPIYDEEYGPHVIVRRQAGWHFVLRDITPEERWLFLRNHIARKIGESPLPGEPVHAEYPQTV
jgi:hypothetical protein